MKSILFGSIGTLIETSDTQRVSFNRAFKEENLSWNWDYKTYKKLLEKSGGIKRIKDYAFQKGEIVNAVRIWKRKTNIFNKIIETKKFEARKGVLNIFRYAKDNNIQIGLVSSTSKKNIDTIFKALNGQISKGEFNFIGNNKLINKPKPEPDIYFKALKIMNLKKNECIAIEDSVESAKSAINAGIQCVAFPGLYHRDGNFEFCKFKVDELDISILK